MRRSLLYGLSSLRNRFDSFSISFSFWMVSFGSSAAADIGYI